MHACIIYFESSKITVVKLKNHTILDFLQEIQISWNDKKLIIEPDLIF